MKKNDAPRPSTDCSRRSFLQAMGMTAGAAAVTAGGVLTPLTSIVHAAPKNDKSGKKPEAESYVKEFYKTLTPQQKKVMYFPFDHKLRRTVRNNWHIVDAKIGDSYTGDQQELIRNILRGVTSEDGYERFQKQMKDDDGGFKNYSCAMFGDPGEGKFEFVMTGRHLTIRADGDSVANAAFGGPIFYGHAVAGNERPDHPGNVWWHQAKLANNVYKALDGRQQKLALLDKSPSDNARSIRLREAGEIPGLPGSELSKDQQQLVKMSLESLLSMFREKDVKEVMQCLEESGGIDSLHMSFYNDDDIGNDGVWDNWKIEGPTFAWYFRGAPHVHTWLNVKSLTKKKVIRL